MIAQWGPDAAQATQSPDASLGLPGLSAIAIVLIVGSLILVAWRRRKGIPGVRGTAGGAAISNALMDFNSIFMPNHANGAVVSKLEEEEHEDHAGEGPEAWTRAEPKVPSPYRNDDGGEPLN